MLNKNGIKIVHEVLFGNATLKVAKNMVGTNGEIITSTNGDSNVNPALATAIAQCKSVAGSKVGMFLVFGSDDTQPTFNDYSVYTELSNLSCGGCSLNKTVTGISVNSAITNVGSEDAEIKEVGLFAQSMSQYGDVNSYMIGRQILDTPVTLKPNQTETLCYNLQFS